MSSGSNINKSTRESRGSNSTDISQCYSELQARITNVTLLREYLWNRYIKDNIIVPKGVDKKGRYKALEKYVLNEYSFIRKDATRFNIILGRASNGYTSYVALPVYISVSYKLTCRALIHALGVIYEDNFMHNFTNIHHSNMAFKGMLGYKTVLDILMYILGCRFGVLSQNDYTVLNSLWFKQRFTGDECGNIGAVLMHIGDICKSIDMAT